MAVGSSGVCRTVPIGPNGNAEILCRDLEIKLTAEETTSFSLDTPIDIAGKSYPSDGYPR
ncbi:hypothetical protein [Botrimarina hoheduenensis]|uniref:hypothetical protein n=1 Tax=Botrimarina hoheduenensis TaxID=2528000 RepID=UPI0011B7ADC4|nr:hypothetical protein [Botrimarina hoheduenensis]